MEDALFEQRTDLGELLQAMNALEHQVKKLIVGQEEMIRLLMAAILADGHVLIEGLPGVAKTLTARLVAKCLHAKFGRIQFTPDLMPSDVLGTNIYNPAHTSFEFKRGPVFGNIVLIDEINRAPAKTQSALFEVMEERQVTMDGISYPLTPPFIVLATQNPIEQEGTYRLPEAQLDRFLFKVKIPYPTPEEELLIIQRFHGMERQAILDDIEPVISGEKIVELRRQLNTIVVDEKLMQFIARIVTLTRNDKSIYLGASPRASLALLQGAKAVAALAGRDFIIPDDVIGLAKPVLRHRIILTPEKEMEGVSEDEIIEKIINSIEVPR